VRGVGGDVPASSVDRAYDDHVSYVNLLACPSRVITTVCRR
jgi:hypothetical protein